ncbi:cytochrome P450 [Artemisia annua]|uniref:Cytochrome P450 n=1 Tax=Artemisia annua TaxID=35608 RepID=A0A2U1KVJ1_ARTAN|nr:cytochrome P450 [Artemisia annua]
MDITAIFILVSIFTCFCIFFTQSGYRKWGANARLPPGPYRLPIIGSIFKLGNKPHHSLAALSKTYGPLMSLKLGSTTMIVVNSGEIVKEFFFKHDISFSSRSIPYATHSHDRHTNSMVWLPVGDKWRTLRKISKEQLFSVHQLDASQHLRKKKVQELLDYVQDCSENGKSINVGQTAATTTLNVLSNFIFSINLAQYDSTSTEHIKDLVWSLMEVGGAPNLADLFPFIRLLDPHRMLQRASIVTGKLFAVFEQHIRYRLEARAMQSSNAPSSTNDLTDLLLDISQNEKSSINLVDIRILIFVRYIYFSL